VGRDIIKKISSYFSPFGYPQNENSAFLAMHRTRRVNVFLNIYELMSFDKYNGYLVPLGLGAYHSGVEIYGEEFSFGFHDGDHSGIFTVDPRGAPDCRFVYAMLKDVIEHTHKPQSLTQFKSYFITAVNRGLLERPS
jgi:hypothetical protein